MLRSLLFLAAATSVSGCLPKLLKCWTLNCGLCGKKPDVTGCLDNGCPDDTFNHVLVRCAKNECHYACSCKNQPVPPPGPVPPTPAPPTPPVPPQGPLYRCVDGTCTEQTNGITKDQCETICTAPAPVPPVPPAPTPAPAPSTAFKCINDKCVAHDSGISKADCETICNSDIGAQGTCALYNMNAALQDAATRVPRNFSAAAPTGPYKVGHGTITNIPGLTKGGKSSGAVWYPEGAGDGEKFPFIAYAHGTGVGGAFPGAAVAYATLLNEVASYGFIIVAPASCPTKECASTYAVDQIATIKACKANPSLHASLASADFSRVGVAGHSMGAMATMASAGGGLNPKVDPSEYSIKAAVSQHPCWDAYEHAAGVKIPIMFTCGSSDKICADGCSKTFYGNVPASVPKILFDVNGASHFEPTNTGDNSEDSAVAHYFACWLRNEQCDKVYGTGGKQICHDLPLGHSTSTCSVSGGGPSGPTPPSPPSPAQKFACKNGVCSPSTTGLDKQACQAGCG